MPLDPSIPLQLKPVQFSGPAQSLGEIMQMRNQQYEGMLRQAQVEQARQQTLKLQSETEQRNRDVADQNTIQEALNDPASAKLFGSGNIDFLNGKIQPKTLTALQESLDKIHKEHAAASDEQIAHGQKQTAAIAEGISGLKTLPTDEARVQAYPELLTRLKGQGLLDGINAPESISGKVEELDLFAAKNGFAQALADKAFATKKEQQALQVQAAKEQREQSEFDTKHPVEEAIAQATLADADLLTPEQRAAQMDRASAEADKNLTTDYKNYELSKKEGFKGTFEQWQDKDANRKRPSTTNIISDPNSPLSGVPRNLTNKASSEYSKVGRDLADARQAADDMNTFIAESRAGNKVAYAYSPVEGVLTLNTGRGVKRVNMAEISHYAGAGSFGDKVESWFGKNVSGASIPEDILKNMESLHGAIAANAQKVADTKVDVVNSSYGSKFKHFDLGGQSNAPAPSSYKAGDYRVLNGVTYTRDDKGNWHPK